MGTDGVMRDLTPLVAVAALKVKVQFDGTEDNVYIDPVRTISGCARCGVDVWLWCGRVAVVWTCGCGVDVWLWCGRVTVVWTCGCGVDVWLWCGRVAVVWCARCDVDVWL